MRERTIAPRTAPPFDTKFNALVERLLKEWHVPGLSIAIIDGPSTHSKGYGYSNYPDTKTTPKTLFYTASTTKSFTAAATSLVIDDSRKRHSDSQEPENSPTSTGSCSRSKCPISWTTPLRTVLPEFSLEDEYTASHVTLEDALSHRAGMPDHTKHFGPREMRVEDAVSAMKYLPLTAEIRTKYMYNNLMYTAVSAALERASGLSLGDFLKERVWRVLGMRDTFWKLAEVQLEDAGEALATGYAWDESTGTYVAEQPPDFGGVSGAGAMISNVLDYAKWIRCMMTRSGPLSPAGHAALVEPRSVYLDHGTNPFPAPHLYALGWFMDMYRGERIIWHGGGITGFGSTMAYLPDRQWGVVMMGNTIRTSNYVQVILSMYLLDELVGTPLSERVDWGGVLRSHIEESRGWFANARERLYPSLPDPVIPSALRVEEYAGRYWHPAYRGVELKVDGEELVADRTSQEIAMNIRLEHVSGESWLATLEIVNQDPRDYEVVRAEFRVEADGVARYVGLDLESEMEGEKIWFERCR